MILYHSGEEAPFFREKVNPNDREPFWISWEWKLGDEGITITNSDWILPTGFTMVESFKGEIAVNECNEFELSNGIVFTTTLTEGQYQIDNVVTYSYNNEIYTLTRGFRFELGFI